MVERGLTFHGLRHTAGTALAEARQPTRAIQVVLGHADEKSSGHYARRAETARLGEAAIRAWERGDGGKSWKTFGKLRTVRKNKRR